MKKLHITNNEAGQRLDKYLKKYFRNAPDGFLYKMLRKKNICLNGKKSKGDERLQDGDEIFVFFSDETFAKMMGTAVSDTLKQNALAVEPDILYEDADILVFNKPAGILSQSDTKDGDSANDYLLQYALNCGFATEEGLRQFRPSVMNRLDRNTSGILLCAKTYPGARYLDDAIKNNEIKKIYRCICSGRMEQSEVWEAFLKKDARQNRVEISGTTKEGFVPIKTGVAPLEHKWDEKTGQTFSLFEVELFTGKSHQIRAHLAFMGHPIIGDPKYGDPKVNAAVLEAYGIRRQLLSAVKVYLPGIGWIESPVDSDFLKIFPKKF